MVRKCIQCKNKLRHKFFKGQLLVKRIDLMSTKNFFKIKRLIVKLTFAVLPGKKTSFLKGSVLSYYILWSKNLFY